MDLNLNAHFHGLLLPNIQSVGKPEYQVISELDYVYAVTLRFVYVDEPNVIYNFSLRMLISPNYLMIT